MMVDMLETIFKLQGEFQTQLYGAHPSALEDGEKIEYLKDMHLALFSEINEIMEEFGWKPWATSRHINAAKAQGEVIDAAHFLVAIALALGMDADLFYQKFHEKQMRNRQRQVDGYDGVIEKCVVCNGDLQDVKLSTGLEPVPADLADQPGRFYCGTCGRGVVDARHDQL